MGSADHERADWEPVRTGMSGAEVRRSPDGDAYAKSGSGTLRDDLHDERERLEWLAGTDLPAAEVLDWADDGETATLTLRTVPGVPMSDLPASAVPDAVPSLARMLRRLHAVDRESCPFERWLAVTVALARVRVDEGLVDEGDFDDDRQGTSGAQLVAELMDGRPRAEELELDDLVVCHGDACLPNFLVDPDTLEVTGMIDVHRLGVADRHLDLALATRSMSDLRLNPAYGPDAADALLTAYGLPADPWRLDFYRLLDEFF
ncbi:MAG TPA: APH(3') family aminoglycoside O-phosphotransferase [Nocardioides sp.]|uniref:APH(3') family aminoglycoside O-phosphotransferase n=1 Tax=Actinomycetes TaxID=1760 RepID=UPI002BA82A77|nr:APH(3') family aminoglycoside O-phosphotransferase [Flexivirga sp.]HWC23074.1 APH(3') family aminoglycoside O-phosphotransferase [Flexivirga sp.]